MALKARGVRFTVTWRNGSPEGSKGSPVMFLRPSCVCEVPSPQCCELGSRVERGSTLSEVHVRQGCSRLAGPHKGGGDPAQSPPEDWGSAHLLIALRMCRTAGRSNRSCRADRSRVLQG
ncbi:hypothetical protein AAFF_G00255500 [Aldrovandia affinis]|uniref:Uncharacterized protein n=1 Tax=Aldrovandia affinis TaxID=143900 RepID=A0AAD7RC86_9TELE|nr:hypothetical protein AAFF_G00255500 [Aldrovandia affinis]